MAIPNILIIGAGSVGAFSAAIMARKQLGTIYLYDIVEDLAVGKAIDINQASPYLHTDTGVIACNSFDEVPGADIIVIAAGHARHAGMTRLDLLNKNRDVMDSLGSLINGFFPQAKVLVVTNPVDVMAWFLKSTWPAMNVFGMGCSLDTLRFRYFIAEATGCSADSAGGIVIGTHNDDMIPLINHATAGGVPVRHLLTADVIDEIIHKTRSAGTTITQKLREHSGYYAAAHVVTQIVESLTGRESGTFPLSVVCNGEYGYEGIPLALPSVLGEEGISQIIEIDLDEGELEALDVCAHAMTEITHMLA